MPLVPAVLGHVDDIAGIQCQPQMWLPVLRAFITLERERRSQGLLEWRVEEGDTLAQRGALPTPQVSLLPTQPNRGHCVKTGAVAVHPEKRGGIFGQSSDIKGY